MSVQERTRIRLESQRWYDRLPASAAVRVGDLVFVSGQLSLDGDAEIRDRGDIRAQARNCFESLRAVLQEAGGTLDDVVDVMSFHTDLRNFEPVFEVAREYFQSDYPAWTPVGTIGLPHPDALVSIRAIAHLGDEPKETFTPESLRWRRDLPMSAGCKKGDLLFIGGVSATDVDGNVINHGDHGAQSLFCWNRVGEIAAMAGGSIDDVVDVITFHQDPRGQEPALDVVMPLYLTDLPSEEALAWTSIGTPGLHKLGMLGAWRAIVDLSPGARIGKTPASLWWKDIHISGASKKPGSNFVGMAGEVASDGDGNITTPGDIAAQARYAFNRLNESLEMFGGSKDNIVEITAYHKDPRAWEIVMEEGRAYFGDTQPAWTPVGMTGLFKEGYVHEIHALAVL